MADGMQALIASLHTLPADQNPYPIFMHYILTANSPVPPDWYLSVVEAAMPLFAILILCCLATLVGKIVSRNFWVVHIKRTSRGILLLPNTTVAWSIMTTVFASMMLAVVVYNYLTYSGKSQSPSAQINIQSGTFWALLQSLIVQSHGLACAAWLFSPSGNKALAKVPAMAVNAVFVFLYVASTIAVFASNGVAIGDFNDGTAGIAAVAKSIGIAAAQWQPGQAFVLDPAWLTDMAAAGATMLEFAHGIQKVFIVLCTFIFVACAIFLVTSALHLSALNTQVKWRLAQARNGGASTNAGSAAAAATGGSSSSFASVLVQQFRGVVLECIANSIASLCVLVIHLYLAVHFLGLFSSGVQVAVVWTIMFLLLSIALIFPAVLSLVRVWRPLVGSAYGARLNRVKMHVRPHQRSQSSSDGGHQDDAYDLRGILGAGPPTPTFGGGAGTRDATELVPRDQQLKGISRSTETFIKVDEAASETGEKPAHSQKSAYWFDDA